MSTATDVEWRPAYGLRWYCELTITGEARTRDRIVRTCHGLQQAFKSRPLTTMQRRGYPAIQVCKQHKQHCVPLAPLMVATWIRPGRPLRQSEAIIYRDGNPYNCAASNLMIVPRGEARRSRHNKARETRNLKTPLQLVGELWRAIPGDELRQISNYARQKSFAMQPPVIRSPSRSNRDVLYYQVDEHGQRTSRSVRSLMSEVWPEIDSQSVARIISQMEARKARAVRAKKGGKKQLKPA